MRYSVHSLQETVLSHVTVPMESRYPERYHRLLWQFQDRPFLRYGRLNSGHVTIPNLKFDSTCRKIQ